MVYMMSFSGLVKMHTTLLHVITHLSLLISCHLTLLPVSNKGIKCQIHFYLFIYFKVLQSAQLTHEIIFALISIVGHFSEQHSLP